MGGVRTIGLWRLVRFGAEKTFGGSRGCRVGGGASRAGSAGSGSAPTPDFTFTGSDFFIPRDADQTDQEGVQRFVASFDLVANGFEDLVGQTCRIIVLAANGDSVHVNNLGLIVTGGSETDVLETESEPNVLRTVLDDPTLVLGETMELYNIMDAR